MQRRTGTDTTTDANTDTDTDNDTTSDTALTRTEIVTGNKNRLGIATGQNTLHVLDMYYI